MLLQNRSTDCAASVSPFSRRVGCLHRGQVVIHFLTRQPFGFGASRKTAGGKFLLWSAPLFSAPLIKHVDKPLGTWFDNRGFFTCWGWGLFLERRHVFQYLITNSLASKILGPCIARANPAHNRPALRRSLRLPK